MTRIQQNEAFSFQTLRNFEELEFQGPYVPLRNSSNCGSLVALLTNSLRSNFFLTDSRRTENGHASLKYPRRHFLFIIYLFHFQKLSSFACFGAPSIWNTNTWEISRDVDYFGTSSRRSSRSAFGRSTGNDVSGHYKRHYFLSFC